jgi:rare lipoprotein A
MRQSIARFLLALGIFASGCASGAGHAAQKGLASYYADRYHGRKTASSEVFDVNAMTAAHRTLPFGTRVRVTNVNNGRSVVVRINDRGPFVAGRVIDLSPAAARRIDMINDGVAPVKLEVLGGQDIARTD